MERTPYDTRFYDAIADGSLQSARKIAPRVMALMDINFVVDIGCGVGSFLRVFSDLGVPLILGADGDHVPRDLLQIPKHSFRAEDFAKPFEKADVQADLVISLEVAEHLPDSAADDFVHRLCAHGDVVMFSAAVPGQGGTHHVNEQWPDYWVAKFAARGYQVLDILRPALWDDTEVKWWYRQNLLMFANAQGLAAHPKLAGVRGDAAGPLNIVHPESYRERTEALNGVFAGLGQACDAGGTYRFVRNAEGQVRVEQATAGRSG